MPLVVLAYSKSMPRGVALTCHLRVRRRVEVAARDLGAFGDLARDVARRAGVFELALLALRHVHAFAKLEKAASLAKLGDLLAAPFLLSMSVAHPPSFALTSRI